ncbi:MAG: SpaA isopeptide-forming pilin-related protein [Christensenellales bacterium]
MKKMKNLRSKIFVILGLFALMIADLNPFFVNAGRENLTYRNAGYPAAMFDNNLNRYTQYGISTVGGNQSYCMDYGYRAPASGASLTYIKTVRSNKLVAVMANGYPNKSVAQLGAVNIDAAYLGTQMAVWQTVNGTSYTKGNAFDLNKIQSAAGYEKVVNNAKQVAAKILASGTYNPTISVSGGKVDYDSYVEMNKIGPFKVNVEGYKYTTFKTSLVNAPEGSYVVDKDNHIRNEYNAGEEVYVLVSKTAAPKKVTLKVTAVANEKVAVLYGAGSSMQNFVFLDFEQKTIEATKQFTWEKREGNIEIVKVDQNGASVEGAEFKVVDESGKQVAKQKTNKEGKITIKGLPVGKYTVTEISAPEGYILNAETKTVTVKTGETARIKAVNEKIIGGLEIIKIDEDTKEKIEGVTFEVYNSNKEVIGKITTGKDGKAVLKIDNMANGTYYYKEISAPDGYIVDSTMKEFKITEENKIAKETVTNKKIRGTLEITKLDDSRVAIEGVKFNILASDKKTVIETLTTDKSGHATTKKLDKGTYYYQEIEVPDGYVKDDEIFEFQINKQNEVVKREVINKRITGNLNVIKVDDNNTPIKGVKFEIYDANKNKVDTITTDENGKAASKDLQIGTYTYKEVSVPKGYVIDENEYEFAVTSKETKIEKTVVNNRAKGALKIIKLEKGTKTPIEGVTFEILDENKNVVDTIVTNKDGIAEKQDLIVGKYYYREISAPDKYIVDSKEKSFKLTDNGEIFEATVYNEAKTLPVTGGSLSLDMLIVLMVAGFSIVGFNTMKVVKEKKEHNL